MANNGGLWWLPGALVASVGVLAIVAGLVTGGPDVVGGVVFGSVALAAGMLMLRRRAPKKPVD
jgi:hypothetical protein